MMSLTMAVGERIPDAPQVVIKTTSGAIRGSRYELSRRATMRFDSTPEVVNDPLSAVRVVWGGVR